MALIDLQNISLQVPFKNSINTIVCDKLSKSLIIVFYDTTMIQIVFITKESYEKINPKELLLL